MGVASQIPVVEGGPAGSGVLEATISAAPERLGGAVLGSILIKHSAKISRTTASMSRSTAVVPVRFQESASRRRGAGELEAIP
jgi:hypothetical protein